MLNYQTSESNFTLCNPSYQKNSNLDILHQKRLVTNVDFELTISTLDILYLEEYERSLNVVEKLLLEGVWHQKTYSEVAKENNYSSDYFSNVAAPKLFKKLSKLVQCRVTKKNCRFLLAKHVASFIED